MWKDRCRGAGMIVLEIEMSDALSDFVLLDLGIGSSKNTEIVKRKMANDNASNSSDEETADNVVVELKQCKVSP